MKFNWFRRNINQVAENSPRNIEFRVQGVYCQHCTANLTEKDVEVSYVSSRVYCPPENGHFYGCLFPAALSRKEISAAGIRMSSDELQRAIIEASGKPPIKYQMPQNLNPGRTLDRLVNH